MAAELSADFPLLSGREFKFPRMTSLAEPGTFATYLLEFVLLENVVLLKFILNNI